MSVDETQRTERGHARTRGRAAFAALALLIALAAAWFCRIYLAETYVRHAFASGGVEAGLTIERLDFGGASVANLRIGRPEAPDFWAKTARFDLAWAWGWPTLRAVTLAHGGWRVRLGDGSSPPGAPTGAKVSANARGGAQLPDWAIDISDFRLIGSTPLGAFDASLEGHGELRRNLRTEARVARSNIAGPAGGATGLEAKLVAATIGGRLTGVLTASADDIVIQRSALRISSPRVSAEILVPVELNDALATIRVAADRAVSHELLDLAAPRVEMHVTAGPFARDFTPSAISGAYSADLGRGLVRDLTFDSAHAAGALNVAGQSFVASSDLQIGDGALSASARKAIDGAIPALGGTPLGPLMSGGKAGLDEALHAFDARAPLLFSLTPDTSRVSLAGAARLNSNSGAHIELAPLSAAPAPSLALADLSLSGGALVTTNGGGLPDASVKIASFEARLGIVEARSEISIRDWRAKDAALTTQGAALALHTDKTGGRLQLGGAALISGPFAGLQLIDAATPLDMVVTWGGGFRAAAVGAPCKTIKAAHVVAPGVAFANADATLCPLTGAAFVSGDAAGALSGGFTLTPIAWSGRMSGGEPARLSIGSVSARIAGRADAAQLLVSLNASAFGADYAHARKLRIDAAAITARLTASDSWRLDGTIENAAAADTSLPARLTEFNAVWSGAPAKSGDAVFRFAQGRGRVLDTSPAEILHTMRVRNVEGSLQDGLLNAQGALALEAKPTQTLGAFTIVHNAATGIGAAQAHARDLMFGADLQPYDISELARGVVDDTQGAVDADLGARWTADDIKTSGSVSLKGIDFATAALGQIEGVSGVIDLDDLTQMATPPAQELRIASVNPGIVLHDGDLKFQLQPQQRVAIEHAQWPFAEGVLAIEPTTLHFGGEETRLSLTLTDVDVAALTDELNINGLTATGTVEGRFPLVFTATKGRIEHGRLQSGPGGGLIAYQGDVSKNAGAANIAFDALRSFHYDDLSLDLDGDLDGELISAIHFSGKNSQPVDPGTSVIPLRIVGIPFKFTVNVRAPFMALAHNAAGFGDATQYLREIETQMDEPATPEATK